MNKTILTLSAMVLIMAFGSSCATILQPGPDRIPVNTDPQGAKVFLNDEPVGTTPMVLNVNRPDDCRIRIETQIRGIAAATTVVKK